MNNMQTFLLEKMKIGANKIAKQPGAPALMTQEDITLLLRKTSDINPRQDEYVGISQSEWLKWSQNMHWVLQIAFSEDTVNFTDMDKLEKWRAFTKYFNSLLINKKVEEILVIDSMASHFMQHDLLPTVVRVYGKRNLTIDEKRWTASKYGPGIGSGCLIPILLSLALIAIIVSVL